MTDYRKWMERNKVKRIEKRFTVFDDDRNYFLLVIHTEDDIHMRLSCYEHGPGDLCYDSRKCGGGMPGWAPLAGALSLLEQKLEQERKRGG